MGSEPNTKLGDRPSVFPDDPSAALADLEARGLAKRGTGDWREHVFTDEPPTRTASEHLAALRGDADDRL